MRTLTNSNYCPNCHYPLRPTAQYCHHCGQKRTDRRVTVAALLREFFTTVFNVDGKIWRTLVALCVPARLTRHYFLGRHQRYVHPLRLFLVAVTGLVAAIFFVVPENTDDDDNFGTSTAELQRSVDHHAMAVRLDSLADRLATGQPAVVGRNLDSLQRAFWAGEASVRDGDSTLLFSWSVLRAEFSDNDDKVDEDELFAVFPRAANADWLALAPDALADKYGITEPLDRFLVKRQARFIRDGRNFNRYVLGNLFWAAALIPVLYALVFKLLYWRRGRYYVEHLIFLLHYLTFIYLVGVGLLLTLGLDGAPPWHLILLALGAYFYAAVYRYYRQGWFKTFAKMGIGLVLFLTFLFPVLMLGFVLINLLIY